MLQTQGYRAYQNTTMVDAERHTITLSDNLPSSVASGPNGSTAHVENGVVYTTYRYTFDRVYGPESHQEEVYEHSARGAVQQVLEVGHPRCAPHPRLVHCCLTLCLQEAHRS